LGDSIQGCVEAEYQNFWKRPVGANPIQLQHLWSRSSDLNSATAAVPGDWIKESVLLAKSEDKSGAFMLTKRSANGILAWALINNWYMATSAATPQSKSDSEVMCDVERWLDEVRELVALGQPDLPPMYKVTGLRQIATQKIRDQIVFQEQRLIGMTPDRMGEQIVGTSDGVIKVRTARRRPKGDQWIRSQFPKMRGLPWETASGRARTRIEEDIRRQRILDPNFGAPRDFRRRSFPIRREDVLEHWITPHCHGCRAAVSGRVETRAAMPRQNRTYLH